MPFADGIPENFTRLLATPSDLRESGVGKEQADTLVSRMERAARDFASFARSQKAIGPQRRVGSIRGTRTRSCARRYQRRKERHRGVRKRRCHVRRRRPARSDARRFDDSSRIVLAIARVAQSRN